MSAYVSLQEDLALHYPEAAKSNTDLIQCCALVHALWVRSVSGPEQNVYARHLCAKFARVNHHQVTNIAPPQLPPTSFPPAQCWVAGHSRRAPDRDQVLRDLNGRNAKLLAGGNAECEPGVKMRGGTVRDLAKVRASGSGRSGKAPISIAVLSEAQFSSCGPSAAQMSAAQRPAGEERLQRANSWCGQRSSARACLPPRSP